MNPDFEFDPEDLPHEYDEETNTLYIHAHDLFGRDCNETCKPRLVPSLFGGEAVMMGCPIHDKDLATKIAATNLMAAAADFGAFLRHTGIPQGQDLQDIITNVTAVKDRMIAAGEEVDEEAHRLGVGIVKAAAALADDLADLTTEYEMAALVRGLAAPPTIIEGDVHGADEAD